MCKEVPGTHAVPSSAEEPPPAFVQPSVERSISLPPAACLAAARSNFLCIVPITVPPLPAHPTPLHAPHCQAPYAPAPAPYLAAPQMSLQMFSCIPAHFTDTLCFPLQPLPESCVPPQDVCLCPQCGCNQRGGMETSRPAQSPGTDARLFLMAMAAVVPRCLLAAPSPPKKYPSLSRWQHPWEELQKQVLGSTLQSYEWKPARWVPVAVVGGCSVQGSLGTCVLLAHSTGVLTGCRGVSTSLRTRCVHLRSRACAHGPVCPAVPIMQTPMHTHGCAAARAHCAGTPQPCLRVHALVATAKPRCAGMLGLEPQGASVPGSLCWHA